MALNIQSIQDLYNNIKSSVFSFTKGQLEVEKDPFASAFAMAMAKLTNAGFKFFNDAVSQTFSQTATDEAFLTALAYDRTNNIIKRKQATFAQGTVVITATSSSDIAAGTQFITSDGQVYSSLVLKTTQTQSFTITSLQRVSGYAIATLADYQLGNAMTITVSGVNEVGFNGDQVIELLTDGTFRWPSSGSDTVATGTIQGSFFGCRVTVQSINPTEDANKDFSNVIALAITNNLVTGTFLTFSGIYGGADIESLTSFKSRIVEFLGTPQNKGNITQHQVYIKQNTSANYAYFFTSTTSTAINLTGVISKLDDSYNFTNFTSDELAAIKTQFINDNQLLLGVNALNLSIVNPNFVGQNVSISGLSPNTIDMQNAITAILKEYFALLTINFYLSSGKPEVLADKVKSIVYLARDSLGNNPTFTSLTMSGSSSLLNNSDKPILGTTTYS